MKWIWGLALGALFAGSANAAENSVSTAVDGSKLLIEKPERTTSGALSISLTGKRFDDEVVNSAYGRGAISFDLKAAYQDWLKGRFAAGQVYSSGTASNLYAVTEGAASSTFAYLDEASLTLMQDLTPNFEVRGTAGVVPVRQNQIMSALWDVNAWAGGRLEAEQTFSDGRLALAAYQGVPGTRDVSNRLFDEDTLPLYTNGNVLGEVKFAGGWKAAMAGAVFVFTDPSSSAAADSTKIGSTTFGNGKSTLFANNYRGQEYAASLGYEDISGDAVKFAVSTLENQLAAEGAATLARAEYKRVGEKWDYTTGLTGFRIESDSVPATYVNPGYGFTNRVGATVSVKAEQRRERFAFSAAYTKANVLDSNALSARDGYQADRDIFTLNAEIKHDLF